MSTEGNQQRWKDYIERPYEPAWIGGTGVAAADRVAHSLEYIAAKLGEITKMVGDAKKG